MKILLLGLTNKAGLAIARNLNKFGYTVDAIYTTDVAARHSKYINKTFFLGYPENNVSDFVDKLVLHLSSNVYHALIPIHDAALEITRTHLEKLSSHVKIIGLNAYHAYQYSINKYEMLKLGEKHHIPIPKTIFVDSIETFNKLDLSKTMFPLVAKPISSAKIVNNQLHHFTVKICKNLLELTDFIRENVNTIPILIQEFIQGHGMGYNFIAKDGIIKNEYIHKRIHEYKGVSTLRESIDTQNFILKDKIHNLVRDMQWNGVGMIEFMITPDNQIFLMEFNGRFFGSTEVSVKAGINLPILFVKQSLLNEEIEKNIKVKHVIVRFLHDEVLYYTAMLFKGKIKSYLKWLIELMRSLFHKNHYLEVSLWNDAPAVLFLYLYDFKRWRTKWVKKFSMKKIKIHSVSKQDLEKAKNITFVCLGNICRSPFAEKIAQKIATQYHFSSVGMIKMENRLSPHNALLAAQDFDIDLSTHLSKYLSEQIIQSTDLFIVMDKQNYLDLLKHGIDKNKIRFLANYEIKDPYGHSVEYFKDIYAQIKSEIEKHFSNKK